MEDRSVVLRGVAFTTPGARPVTATVRKIEADENTLRYTMEMEAVGQPLQHHLAATLTRVGS